MRLGSRLRKCSRQKSKHWGEVGSSLNRPQLVVLKEVFSDFGCGKFG